MSTKARRPRMTRRARRKNKNTPSSPQPLATKHHGAVMRTLAMSPELDVTLSYRYASSLSSGVVPRATKEFNPNAAYDVDPSLGSTETAGFDEYAHLYLYYRVISYKYKVTFLNDQAANIAAVYLYNTNSTLTGSSDDIISAQPWCHRQLLGNAQSGHARVTFSGHVDIAKLVGSQSVETDDNYRSGVTSTPADKVHMTLVAISNAATLGTVHYMVQVDMRVRFYDRNWDLTLAGLANRTQELVRAREQWNLKKRLDLNSSSGKL